MAGEAVFQMKKTYANEKITLRRTSPTSGESATGWMLDSVRYLAEVLAASAVLLLVIRGFGMVLEFVGKYISVGLGFALILTVAGWFLFLRSQETESSERETECSQAVPRRIVTHSHLQVEHARQRHAA